MAVDVHSCALNVTASCPHHATCPTHPSQLMRRMTYNAEDGSWTLRPDAAPATTRAGQGSAMRRPASARQPGSRFRAPGPVLFLDADTPQLRSLDIGGMPWVLA